MIVKENLNRKKIQKEISGERKIKKVKRTTQELKNKTKARTIVKDKWGRKKYLQKCDSDTIEDAI